MPHLKPPTPADILAARHKAKHTQTQAGDVVHSTKRRWAEWESGDHRMHPGLWELYLLRTQATIFTEPADLVRLQAQGVNS